MSPYQATLNAPIGSHLERKDVRVIERDGWFQLISPTSGSASGNEVYLSKNSPEEIERVIDDVISQYNTPFKWCVGPWTEPQDLEQRLLARGFTSWGARGMYTEVMDVSAPHVRVDEATPEIYVDTMARGWNMTAEERRDVDEVWRTTIARADRKHFGYVAFLDDKPVGAAGIIMKPESGYFTGAVVLDGYRGKGIYRALLAARLAVLRERGISLATTHAREATSAPILEKLGWSTAFRYRVCLSKSVP
jgi:GNAT superfamily N-acetyltransferase